jgi:hypothetical protein
MTSQQLGTLASAAERLYRVLDGFVVEGPADADWNSLMDAASEFFCSFREDRAESLGLSVRGKSVAAIRPRRDLSPESVLVRLGSGDMDAAERLAKKWATRDTSDWERWLGDLKAAVKNLIERADGDPVPQQSDQPPAEMGRTLLATDQPCATAASGLQTPDMGGNEGGERPSDQPTTEELMLRMAQAVGDDNAAQILAVAQRKDLTGERKMEQILRMDRRYAGKNSNDWAILLGVKPAAIRQYAIWKGLQEAKKRDD